MPDFFPSSSELTIDEIVALTRAKPRAGLPLDRRIANIAPLDTARACDIMAACGQLKSETEKLSVRERQALRAMAMTD